MKIHYTWSKTCNTEPEEKGCFYMVIDDFSNYDFISCVTDIFSAAIAVWEELDMEYDVNDNIIDDIVKAFQDKKSYTFSNKGEKRTYSIKPINLWKVKEV